MKANEAPERIYLLPRQGGDYAPYWRTDSQDGFGIEYINTDAFIEKACDYLSFHLDTSKIDVNYKFDFIEEFRKYIKGE